MAVICGDENIFPIHLFVPPPQASTNNIEPIEDSNIKPETFITSGSDFFLISTRHSLQSQA